MTRTTLAVLVCVTLAACGACRGEEERTMTTNSPPAVETECESALRHLGKGELTDWKGLPAGCGTADLSKVWSGGGDPAGNGKLSTRPTRFRNYRVDTQAQPLQVWFDADDHAMLITWIQPTVEGSVKDVLDALGAPDKKLDPTIGYHADAYQWIYAARGLTLYVREHDWSLARISAYVPTTVEDYEDRLGARDRKEYLPRGR
jgi:hypothetical protein